MRPTLILRITTILSLFIGASAMAHAQTVPTPENCTPVATVLKNSCVATTIFDCGDTKRSQSYVNGVFEHEHTYSSDWVWRKYGNGRNDLLGLEHVDGSGDAMSLAALVDQASSPAAGSYVMKTGRIDRTFHLRGENLMTGETISLGGVDFQVGKLHRIFEPKPGAGGLEFKIDILVSQDRDLVIEGAWTRNAFGAGEEVLDSQPQAIAWPGEEGFLADRSTFGCEG